MAASTSSIRRATRASSASCAWLVAMLIATLATDGAFIHSHPAARERQS